MAWMRIPPHWQSRQTIPAGFSPLALGLVSRMPSPTCWGQTALRQLQLLFLGKMGSRGKQIANSQKSPRALWHCGHYPAEKPHKWNHH